MEVLARSTKSHGHPKVSLFDIGFVLNRFDYTKHFEIKVRRDNKIKYNLMGNNNDTN